MGVVHLVFGYTWLMKKRKNVDIGGTAGLSSDEPAAVAEAIIVAGGDLVGTTSDDEPLVEGPNSK